MSQQDVANVLKMSQRGYSYYEKEEDGRIPEMDLLVQLLDLLDFRNEYEQFLRERGILAKIVPKNEQVDSSLHIESKPLRFTEELNLVVKVVQEANEKVLEEKEHRRKDSEKTVTLLSRLLEDKIDKINVNLSETHDDINALMIQQRSEHASMMDALDRIEGKPVGTIAKEASTVELAAVEALKDSGKKKAAHK